MTPDGTLLGDSYRNLTSKSPNYPSGGSGGGGGGGGGHKHNGTEDCDAAAAAALKPGDRIVPTYLPAS